MLDTSLLLSVVVVIFGLQLTLRLFPPIGFDRHQLSGAASTPAFVGFVAARIVFVLLDDPQTLTRFKDVLVFRSGLEFWPGALVFVLVLGWKNRRIAGGLGPFMAASVPYGFVGLALYEAACLLRDGCLGPTANFGLTPYGLEQPMYPVGLFVALALGAAAWLLRRHRDPNPACRLEKNPLAGLEAKRRSGPPDRCIGLAWLPKLLISAAILGGIRTVASWFLPAIGTSRVELESTTVLILATIGFVIAKLLMKSRRRKGSDGNEVDERLLNITKTHKRKLR